MKKKILISGAGVAGLCTALQLDRSKYDIHVIERASDFVNIGFSIILWKSGYSILKKILGDLPAVYPVDKFSVCAGDTVELLHSTSTAGIGHSVERGHLINMLSAKFMHVVGPAGVVFNRHITSIDYDSELPTASFNDGTSSQYDLVIAADGMHSGVRDANFESSKSTASYTITYVWVKSGSKLYNEALIGIVNGVLFLVHTVGKKVLLGYYNHGDTQENDLSIKRITHFINNKMGGSLEVDSSSAHDFMSESIHVEKANNRRVVLVGDAYHGHSPTLALGTTMAIEDSQCLASLLNDINLEDFQTGLNEVFASYNKVRSARIGSAYGFQDHLENLLITDNAAKIKAVSELYKHAGWVLVEPWFKRLVAGS